MSGAAVIVGAGPGLGAALGRRFARAGCSVALLARNPDTLAPVEGSVRRAAGEAASPGRVLALPCDATDAQAVAAAFKAIRAAVGAPGILVYNAGGFVRAKILDLDPDRFEEAWRVNCLGALLCAQQVLPDMLRARRGTILLTGATASLRGSAAFAGFAVGKVGLRALAQSMARELGPQGIHVAHVIIDGQIGPPAAQGTAQRGSQGAGQGSVRPETELPFQLDPDALAEQYWQLHRQDPSVWTLELDTRPALEKF
jgi:NAD(P)-dependent dehydrogenase (short-subunit alcohol dehydrogenase family)